MSSYQSHMTALRRREDEKGRDDAEDSPSDASVSSAALRAVRFV